MNEGKPLPIGKDYQLGEMYDEYNVRQYVLKRDNYTCQYCGAHPTEKTGVKLHVHHIESRKTGGNAPSNLITLCEHCHKQLHDGSIVLTKKRGRSMRDAAFMVIIVGPSGDCDLVNNYGLCNEMSGTFTLKSLIEYLQMLITCGCKFDFRDKGDGH